jgi:pyridoxamine 5'-phosphate oxidase
MCFHWKSLQRQIRIVGNVTQVSDKEADLYFNSRPYESKISAWASNQSNPMKEKVRALQFQ